MKYETFEDWFLEVENFGTRSERFYESLKGFQSDLGIQANSLLWLKAAFDAAREVEQGHAFDTTEVKEMSMKLYKESNCSYMDCVNAIIKFKCDYDKARDFLLTRFQN